MNFNIICNFNPIDFKFNQANYSNRMEHFFPFCDAINIYVFFLFNLIDWMINFIHYGARHIAAH